MTDVVLRNEKPARLDHWVSEGEPNRKLCSEATKIFVNMLYRGSHDDRYTKDGERCARITVWIEMYHCHTVAERLNENTGVVNLGFKTESAMTSSIISNITYYMEYCKLLCYCLKYTIKRNHF